MRALRAFETVRFKHLRRCIIAAVAISLALIIARGLRSWSFGPSPVTDASRYVSVLHELSYPGADGPAKWVASTFPPAIPPDATNVRFCYEQIMRGGSHLQLSMCLPSSRVTEMLAPNRKRAKRTLIGHGFGDMAGYTTTLPRLMRTDAAIATSVRLPNDFEIFVLDAQQKSYSSEWTAGSCVGIAINRDSNEVIYWFDDW